MVEAAGYVPVALSADDYIELLPARWQAINAYGIKVSRRTYDGQELNPFRQQPSGVKEHKDRWEVHYDPYDVSRIWVRDHWNGGWITVFWTQLHRVAAPFGELAWDHARSSQPGATEAELADAVAACCSGPARDPPSWPGNRPEKLTRRDRRSPPGQRPPSRCPSPGRPPRSREEDACRCARSATSQVTVTTTAAGSPR